MAKENPFIDTSFWLVALPKEEGEALLKLTDAHRDNPNHRKHPDGTWHYDPECSLCRAGSRLSVARDYGTNLFKDDLPVVRKLIDMNRTGVGRPVEKTDEANI